MSLEPRQVLAASLWGWTAGFWCGGVLGIMVLWLVLCWG